MKSLEPQLTDRQKEIAHLVATGMPQKEVAYHLHISTQTVKNHLTTIYRKLKLSGAIELTQFIVVSDMKDIQEEMVGKFTDEIAHQQQDVEDEKREMYRIIAKRLYSSESYIWRKGKKYIRLYDALGIIQGILLGHEPMEARDGPPRTTPDSTLRVYDRSGTELAL